MKWSSSRYKNQVLRFEPYSTGEVISVETTFAVFSSLRQLFNAISGKGGYRKDLHSRIGFNDSSAVRAHSVQSGIGGDELLLGWLSQRLGHGIQRIKEHLRVSLLGCDLEVENLRRIEDLELPRLHSLREELGHWASEIAREAAN